MVPINVNEVPSAGLNHSDGFRVSGEGLEQARWRERKVPEVLKRVLKVVQIVRVRADGIPRRRKGRDALDKAWRAIDSREHRGQAQYLAPVNSYFKKAGRHQFPEQQEPFDMHRILAEAPALAAEIGAMLAQLQWQMPMEITEAVKIEFRRRLQAPGPISAVERGRSRLFQDASLLSRREHPAITVIDEESNRHPGIIAARVFWTKTKVKAGTALRRDRRKPKNLIAMAVIRPVN